MIEINDRLRSERERLGLTQQEIADLVSVSKRTVIDWEKGVSSPTVVKLSALGAHSFDVTYIITGERTGARDPLTPREQAVIDNYRASDDTGKRAVEATASALAQPAKRGKAG